LTLTVDTLSDVNTYGLDIKNREIYLHAYLGAEDEDPGVDHRMAALFYRNIRTLDLLKGDPIVIHMSSVGGTWGAGMAIFDAINMCKSHVTIIAYGQAESMSSIILQSADKRIMMPNAYHMCHYGSSEFSGNHLDIQKRAYFEKRICEEMLDIYSFRCMAAEYFRDKWDTITEEKVKNYLKRKLKDGDWYMTAEEAVYYGFADGVLSTRKYPHIDSLKIP